MGDVISNTISDLADLNGQLIEDDGTVSIAEGTNEYIPVVLRTVRIVQQDPGHAFVVGHPLNGIVGTALGYDGQQVLVGSIYSGVTTTMSVVSQDDEFQEFARITNFVDADITSATVDTTGFSINF